MQTLFVDGQAKYFCFSLLDFMSEIDTYLNMIKANGLQLHKLGDVKQRDYKNEEEKRNMLSLIKKRRGSYPAESEMCLMASVYIASRPHGKGQPVRALND